MKNFSRLLLAVLFYTQQCLFYPIVTHAYEEPNLNYDPYGVPDVANPTTIWVGTAKGGIQLWARGYSSASMPRVMDFNYGQDTFKLVYQAELNGQAVYRLYDAEGNDVSSNAYEILDPREVGSDLSGPTKTASGAETKAGSIEVSNQGSTGSGAASKGQGSGAGGEGDSWSAGDVLQGAGIAVSVVIGVDAAMQLSGSMSSSARGTLQANRQAISNWKNAVVQNSLKFDGVLKKYKSSRTSGLSQSFQSMSRGTYYGDGLDQYYSGNLHNFPGSVKHFESFDGTLLGEEIRNQANRYADYWNRSDGLKNLRAQDKVLYYSGWTSLNEADRLAVAGDTAKAIAHSQNAKLYMDILNGSIDGVGDAFTEMANNWKELADLSGEIVENLDNPQKLGEMFGEFIDSIPDIAKEMQEEMAKNAEILRTGTPYQKARLLSKIATEAAVDYATGAAAKAAKASKYGKRARAILRKVKKDIKSLPKSIPSRSVRAGTTKGG